MHDNRDLSVATEGCLIDENSRVEEVKRKKILCSLYKRIYIFCVFSWRATSTMVIATIAAALDAAAVRSPSRLALTSPFQSNQKFTYEELRRTTNALASWLSMYGFEKNDLIVSDLPNISENLMLQVACNRIGVGYGTAKNIETMAKFPKVKGAVSATGSGFLADTNLALPVLSGDFLLDLIHNGGLDGFGEDEELDDGDKDIAHGFYNSVTAYTNSQALQHGRDAVHALPVIEDDVVCVAVTLCHPFGIGSAVCSALLTGATLALPAVGGIQGCGVPSERAAATLDVLESEKCTLLFADTHTLNALPELSLEQEQRLALRGGVCKIGSGSTYLDETREYAKAKLRTIGKAT